jgi:hypothetical protein
MKQHPELKAILADFLQFLLLRKPHDVASFAAEFFSSYSAKAPPSVGFAASSVEGIRPLSTFIWIVCVIIYRSVVEGHH